MLRLGLGVAVFVKFGRMEDGSMLSVKFSIDSRLNLENEAYARLNSCCRRHPVLVFRKFEKGFGDIVIDSAVLALSFI